MAVWWIKKNDVPIYRDLMHKEGSEGHIYQTYQDFSQVDFTNSAMTIWVQSGYWYGGSPNALSGFYYKLKNSVKKLFLRR